MHENHTISLYCPRDVHRKMAFTIPCDLKLASLSLEETVEVVTTLEKVEEMEYLIFSTMDVLPERDRDIFAKMCQKTFK